MWILIWKIWLSPTEVITEWEGNYPKKTRQECVEFAKTRVTPKHRMVFDCRFYTKAQYNAIINEVHKRKHH